MRDDADREPSEAPDADAQMESVLDLVARSAGAQRTVLWNVDPDGGIAQATAASTGRLPNDVRLYGDALRWVWAEGVPLRVNERVVWAPGAASACAAALRARASGPALITLEYGDGDPLPTDEVLMQASSYVYAFTTLREQQHDAVAMRERLTQVLDLLRTLPRELDLATFTAHLAESARQLVGATGATVATWDGEGGQIAAISSEDGGAAIGSTFTGSDSELGLAARAASIIERADRRSQSPRPPVGAPGEQWRVEPRSLTTIPLIDLDRNVAGVLAVWHNRAQQFDEDARQLLDAIAPYVAQQLQHARAYRDLQHDAERDGLTELHNRRAFEDRFRTESARAARSQRPFSVVLLDIDHFKKINDTHGHDTGDTVLRMIGQVLRSSLRGSDFAARYGGEEFVVLLPETDVKPASELAERLRKQVEAADLRAGGAALRVTASFGVATCPASVRDPGSLVKTADEMLYKAKESGRNRVVVAPSAGAQQRLAR